MRHKADVGACRAGETISVASAFRRTCCGPAEAGHHVPRFFHTLVTHSAISREHGYAMAVLLVAMSMMAIMLSVAMPVWRQTAQREKETELVFRGQQYARAIGLFQRKSGPGTLPPNIDVLVDQRFLRKKFKDPITNDDFQPLLAGQAVPGLQQQGAGQGAQQSRGAGSPAAQPFGAGAAGRGGATSTIGAAPGASTTSTGGVTGGLMGVASKSKEKSIRIYQGRTHYNEWSFIFVPQVQAPGAAGAGGAAPGVGGQRQGQGGPGGVGGVGGRGGRDGRGGPDGQRGGRGGPFGPGGPTGPGGPQGPGGRQGPITPIFPSTPGQPQAPRGR